jgi:formate hydrogenlyase transcriptional activator
VLEIDPKVFEAAPAAAAGMKAVANNGAGEATGLEDVERSHILAVLRRTNWVIEGPRGAATVLEMHPNTLRSRLKRLGISRATHEGS